MTRQCEYLPISFVKVLRAYDELDEYETEKVRSTISLDLWDALEFASALHPRGECYDIEEEQE